MTKILQIQDQEAGSVGLSKWLNLPTGDSPLEEILTTMFPMMEMRTFQRDFRFVAKTQAVGIGETAAFVWDVPPDEQWKLMLMWIQHDGLSAGGLVFEFRKRLVNRLPSLFFSLWQGEIDDDLDGEVVYPSAVQRARVTTNRFVDLRGNPDVEFWPQDELSVIMNDVSITAGQVQVASLYELQPRARSIKVGVPVTSVSV